MTTYRCDRCQAISDKPATVILKSSDPYTSDPSFDICEKCYAEIFPWTKITFKEINSEYDY